MARIDDLITETLSISKRVLASYKKPVMGCSFGKDSMVLLHILINHGFKPPIVFYRDPWWPQKYRFADQMISEWDLETYDYPPSAITMWEGKEIMAFTNHYCVSNQTNGVLCLPKNILEPEPNRKWVCGVELLNRPKGTFQFPWDVVFIGHKSSDTDQIAGNVKLRVDIKKNSGIGPDFVFPLRNWTDDDVWEYTDLYTVPQQWDRYNKVTKKENPDKWTNSDYANVCISCMDRRNKSVSVYCPKMKCEVSNISSLVPYQEASMDYFGDDNGKS